MANGLGADFVRGSFLTALAGAAALLVLTTAGAFLARRRDGEVPAEARYLAVGFLALALALALMGLVALVDEAAVVVAFLLVTVFGPLALVGARVHRDADADPLDALAATAMVWGVPFLAGVVVLLVVAVAGVALDVGASGVGRATLDWAGALVAGAVVVVGTLLFADSVMRLLRIGR